MAVKITNLNGPRPGVLINNPPSTSLSTANGPGIATIVSPSLIKVLRPK